MRPTDEQATKAYENAPKAIQDTLSDGAAIDFMVGLQARYSLHIDVAGSVIERIRDLLLGLSNPTEFLGELIQLGITDTVARTLVGGLNKEGFRPLRGKMKSKPKGKEPAQTPEPVTVPQQSLGAQTTLPAPALDYAPAPTLPGSPVAAPMPTTPPVPTEPSVMPVLVSNPHPMPQAAPQQGWHSAAAVHIYVPSHGAPYQAPQEVRSEEKVVDVAEVSAPSPVPSTVPAPIKAPVEPATTTPEPKNYAADPYREPV